MHNIDKYDNLRELVPNLQNVLFEAIQSEFLEMRKINTDCEKFIKSCTSIPELTKASYVIFSRHIKKNEHQHEMFAFVDNTGAIVKHVSGKDMELYGLLSPCSNLHISDEFTNDSIHNDSCTIKSRA